MLFQPVRAADCFELKAFSRSSVRPTQPFFVVYIHVADDYTGNTILRQALELLIETPDRFQLSSFAKPAVPNSEKDRPTICVNDVPTTFIHFRKFYMDNGKLERIPDKQSDPSSVQANARSSIYP